jgi:hypothetical protein
MNCVHDHREQADERATASEVPFTEKAREGIQVG